MTIDGEGSLSKKDLFSVRDLIQKRTGLFFPESKFKAIERPVSVHYRNSAQPDFEAYLQYLGSRGGQESFKSLISLLTTNETFFFRGKPCFEMLEKVILPDLLKGNSRDFPGKKLAIWSAGCSTGEEPYSLSILLDKLLPGGCSPDRVNLVGTDIDRKALERAVEGIYTRWSFRGVDSAVIHSCFNKKGDRYHIKDRYRQSIQFLNHNLVSRQAPQWGGPQEKFDLIICRNVTIYFDQPTVKALSRMFYDNLREGGYLVVGHAEHSAENYPLFKVRAFPGGIVYKKEQETLPLPEKREEERIKSPRSSFTGEGGNREALKRLLSQKSPASMRRENYLPRQEKRDRQSEETKIFEEALDFYKEKKYDHSLDRFLRIIDINPVNVRACWMLSHIAANRGNFEEAIAWGKRSIEIDPLFKEAYYTLALTHMAQGDLDEAEVKIKRTIYIDSNFILGYFTLGNVYALKKQDSQAKKNFLMAKELLRGRQSDEVILEAEQLTVKELLGLIDLKARTP